MGEPRVGSSEVEWGTQVGSAEQREDAETNAHGRGALETMAKADGDVCGREGGIRDVRSSRCIPRVGRRGVRESDAGAGKFVLPRRR